MECASVISEPCTGPRIFPNERSQSMTVLSPQIGKPRLTYLESLEAKMANIEVSLSGNARRRRGVSLGGCASSRSTHLIDSCSHSIENDSRLAHEDGQTVAKNIRDQYNNTRIERSLCQILDDQNAAEFELQKLRIEAENKRKTINNLKKALETLNVTDNIDIRIRQAELEYAYGREELLLLTVEEKIRSLQFQIDKMCKQNEVKNETSLYHQIQSRGLYLNLCAVPANFGRFGVISEENRIYIDWVLEGEGLLLGDQIIEYNGKFIDSKSEEEIRKLINTSGKCKLVVIRKRTSPLKNQMLLQSQEDNLRLQHRISYLEDQVKELKQATKVTIGTPMKSSKTHHLLNKKGDHVTSINISSSESNKDTEPQIFQRGDFIATIIGGKAVQTDSIEAAKISKNRSTEKGIEYAKSDSEHDVKLYNMHQKMRNGYKPTPLSKKTERGVYRDNHCVRSYCFDQLSPIPVSHDSRSNIQNHLGSRRQIDNVNTVSGIERYIKPNLRDFRAAKSLDLEQENNLQKNVSTSKPRKSNEIDYTSEPSTSSFSNNLRRNGRPTPPKKPLRLSLQRAQSLQTIELNAVVSSVDYEKKRATKRTHRGNHHQTYNEGIL